MTFLLSETSESLGSRLAPPQDSRQQLRPLSAAWLSHSAFSLNSLRVINNQARERPDNYLAYRETTPPE
jgi:hypothetical protein